MPKPPGSAVAIARCPKGFISDGSGGCIEVEPPILKKIELLQKGNCWPPVIRIRPLTPALRKLMNRLTASLRQPIFDATVRELRGLGPKDRAMALASLKRQQRRRRASASSRRRK